MTNICHVIWMRAGASTLIQASSPVAETVAAAATAGSIKYDGHTVSDGNASGECHTVMTSADTDIMTGSHTVTKPRPRDDSQNPGLTRTSTSPTITTGCATPTEQEDLGGLEEHCSPCRFNLFTKLGLFFHVDGEKAVPDDYQHSIVAVDDYRLLPALLEDMMTRQLYTTAQLVQQLVEYSKGRLLTQQLPSTTTRGRAESPGRHPMLEENPRQEQKVLPHPHPAQLRQFVASLYTATADCHWDDLDSSYKVTMDWLLASTPGAFETLFHEVLSTPLRKAWSVRHRRHLQQGILMLEHFLQNAASYHGKNWFPRVAELPLSLGETPMMSACRHRNADVVLLLLRHGVRGAARWMNYRSALEVLLFTPSRIQLEDADKKDLELCLEYYLRGHDPVQIKQLEDKVFSAYHVLDENWRDLLPAWCYREPRPLVHLTRMCIRDSLMTSGGLPTAIADLPIPRLLRDYVDLRS